MDTEKKFGRKQVGPFDDPKPYANDPTFARKWKRGYRQQAVKDMMREVVELFEDSPVLDLPDQYMPHVLPVSLREVAVAAYYYREENGPVGTTQMWEVGINIPYEAPISVRYFTKRDAANRYLHFLRHENAFVEEIPYMLQIRSED